MLTEDRPDLTVDVVGRLMAPYGHEVRPAYTVDELKAGQVDGTLQFHCAQCDTDWKPTAEEHAQLQRWLEKHST